MIAAFVHAIADDPRVAAVGFGQAGGISPDTRESLIEDLERYLSAIGTGRTGVL